VADPVEASKPAPALPAPPPPADRETALTYKPLSPTALAGFGVASAYALLIVGGAVLGFFNRAPFILPMWTFLIPAGAVFLCIVGQIQIQSSEGVRSGLALSKWGLRISVVAASLYAAYYGGTRLVVGNQASKAGDEFVETLQKGDIEGAFYLATPPPRQTPAPNDLRGRLELQYNTSPNPNAPGDLTGFTYQDYVRILQQTGKEAHWTYRGVRSWPFEGNGYKVTLLYDVETPLANFSLLVVLLSNEKPSTKTSGRQWQVSVRETRRADAGEKFLEYTDEGRQRQLLGISAEEFAMKWAERVNFGDLYTAYLLTLPPEQQVDSREHPSIFLGRPGSEGWRQFHSGGLVKAEEPVFWSDKEQKTKIIEEAKKLFTTPGPKTGTIRVEPLIKNGVVALCEKNDKEVVIRCDGRLTLPSYVVDVRLHVVCDTASTLPNPSTGVATPTWRIREVEMLRGRTPTAPQQNRPAAPGGIM
jgi:hypothetical protein